MLISIFQSNKCINIFQDLVEESINDNNQGKSKIEEQLKRQQNTDQTKMNQDQLSVSDIETFLSNIKKPNLLAKILSSQKFLEKFHYVLQKLIGSGAFGVVGEGLKIDNNNEKVAIKLVSFDEIEELKQGIDEAQSIRKLTSKWIVKYVDTLIDTTDKYICIITQFYPKGDLHKYYLENKNLSQQDITSIFSGILKGIIDLHDKKIIHRDLKPQNILISENLEPLLCDLGISDYKKSNLSHLEGKVGTPAYISKEQDEGKQSFESDYYSAGAILCFLCGLEFEKDIFLIDNLQNGKFPDVQGHVNEKLLLIAFSMMATDPQLRQSPQKILSILESIHPIPDNQFEDVSL